MRIKRRYRAMIVAHRANSNNDDDDDDDDDDSHIDHDNNQGP